MEWLNTMLNRRDTLVTEINLRNREMATLKAANEAAAEELEAIERALKPATGAAS